MIQVLSKLPSLVPVIGKAIVNGVKRITVNPFAGKTMKEGLKSIGSGAVKTGVAGGTAAAAYTATESTITGEPVDFNKVLKSTIIGVSAGSSPLATILGFGTGVTKNIVKEGMSLFNQGKSMIPANWQPKTPDLPQTGNFDMPSFSFSQAPINIEMQSPQVPQTGGAGFSFSPSVSAGGGMGEVLPLMLLLAGGGALGGYALGRKKRKKYKKRKRRK